MIGHYASDYDFVLLQEVFLPWHRGQITRAINHRERFSNRFQTTPLLRLNSGLFNLSKPKIVASSFKSFSRCQGEICYADKGVLHTRSRLANGAEVDIYNTHLQPFRKGGDVRLHQLEELLSHIRRTNDGKRAVLLVGDLNTSRTRPDFPHIMKALEEFGLTDAWTLSNPEDPGHTWNSFINSWAQLKDKEVRTRHRLDYVFFKSGSRDKVRVLDARIVFNQPMPRVDSSEEIFLSDHFGIEVELQIERN
jgi:endonuclease/exonuclease/phosphatase family metal-dependent hydrolase